MKSKSGQKCLVNTTRCSHIKTFKVSTFLTRSRFLEVEKPLVVTGILLSVPVQLVPGPGVGLPFCFENYNSETLVDHQSVIMINHDPS